MRAISLFFLAVLHGGIGRGRPALADLLAFLEVTADGAITARDDLLPFLQAVGDFPKAIVTNTDFHRDHFGFVAIEEEDNLNRLGGVVFGFAVTRRRTIGA